MLSMLVTGFLPFGRIFSPSEGFSRTTEFLRVTVFISDDEERFYGGNYMAKIIDIVTRKKWRGAPRGGVQPSQGAARMGRLTANEAAYVARRGETGFTQVGEIAASIVERLAR